jgi:general secretion pathway protein A
LYLQYFGLNEAPFSITPDPSFVYLSGAHRDALAHLMYGVGQGGSGGFVQLTGEVGTGKTTLCRCLLDQVPDDCQVALVLNPLMTPHELLATICEELGIDTEAIRDSNKGMVDALNTYLLEQHALGRRVVVVVDEAQNLSPEALEQVRLLTNLETAKHKLLQMVLLGQPELRQLLKRQDLRQLAQRITARYHLMPLDQQETAAYVLHRMKVAGAQRNPFRKSALRALYQRSHGVPRLINIIADRSLAAAYASEAGYVTAHMVNVAANEVQPSEDRVRLRRWPALAASAAAVSLLLALALIYSPPGWMSLSEGEQPVAGLSGANPIAAIEAQSETGREPRSEPGPESGSAAAVVVQAESPQSPVAAKHLPTGLPASATSNPSLTAGSMPANLGAEASPVGSQAQPPTTLEPGWLDDQHRAVWQSLAELWRDAGSARAIQAACDGAARTGFACIREQGNWSRIRQLGLPVVLVLRADESRLLLLQGMSADEVLVGGPGEDLTVAHEAVEQSWLGEYYVVWPQAPDWPAEIRRGESGAAVDIVMEMATLAEPAWTGSGVFDERFETWLMGFQRRNGLRADGIIGPRTLMHLVAPTIVEPRLVGVSGEGT